MCTADINESHRSLRSVGDCGIGAFYTGDGIAQPVVCRCLRLGAPTLSYNRGLRSHRHGAVTYPDPTRSAERLLAILELERVEENLYLGDNEDPAGGRLFGGQVLAQALEAACRTVPDDRLPNSAHGYFLRPGVATRRVLYEVERIRDGRSFVTRRVVAIQNGVAIFSLDVSFQGAETGLDHADSMPNVPFPERLADDLAVARAAPEDDPRYPPWARRGRAFETRSVYRLDDPRTRIESFWNPMWVRFRLADALAGRTCRHALLAYASDLGMVAVSALPHRREALRSDFMMASLDHSLWFHRRFALDQWLLFVRRSSTAVGARGMNHGEFFSTDGQLVASVSQEGLMRVTTRSPV